MAIDNDLSALMPDPPPPRPARREAAIEQALRRFDGEPAPARVRPTAARAGWGRPQIAALASAALVVLITVPVWWAERDRIIPPASPTVATTRSAVERAPVPAASRQSAPAVPAPTVSAPTASAPAAPAAATPAEPAPPPAPPALEANLNRLPQFAPPAPAASTDTPAPPPAAPQQSAAAPPRAAPARRPATAARAEAGAAAEADADADADRRIVVTGSRVQRQDFNSATPIVTVDETLLHLPGDWTACTLRDPNRDLDACRSLADPAAPGAAGRAAAQLAQGLELGWQGELDRAIDAFDRAIGADPELAIAYLNRGLARQAKGDLRRAMADLDRAVARDRDSARNYYHRSLLHRERGDTRRAEVDAKRAIELDPRYRAVLP